MQSFAHRSTFVLIQRSSGSIGVCRWPTWQWTGTRIDEVSLNFTIRPNDWLSFRVTYNRVIQSSDLSLIWGRFELDLNFHLASASRRNAKSTLIVSSFGRDVPSDLETAISRASRCALSLPLTCLLSPAWMPPTEREILEARLVLSTQAFACSFPWMSGHWIDAARKRSEQHDFKTRVENLPTDGRGGKH